MRCHDGFTLDLYEVLCEIIKTYQHILKHIEIYWNFINTTYQRSARSFRFIGFIFTKQTAAGHHFDECLPRFARHVSLCRGGWNPWRCSKKERLCPCLTEKKYIWTRDRQVAASCYLFAPAKDAQSGGHRQGAEPRRIQKRGDAFSRFYRFGGGYTTILAGWKTWIN